MDPEERELRDAVLGLDKQQRQYVLYLHRNQKFGPLLNLASKESSFITELLWDEMKEEKVYSCVGDLEIRKDLFHDLMKMNKQHNLAIKLNAAVFAIFMVAPINSLKASLQNHIRLNNQAEIQSFVGQCSNTARFSIQACMSASAGITHIRTPSLASSQGSGRSADASKLCKQRDSEMCVITGMPHPEACYIFPFAGSKRSKTYNILSALRAFWGDEIANRISALIQNRDVTESPENLISLNRQIHYWFDNGFMALKPLRKNPDGSVDVQLHWLRQSSLKPSDLILQSHAIENWTISAGIDSQCWGEIRAHRFSGLRLRTGQVFTLRPRDRPKAEAPNFDLLLLSWDLLRVGAISGAAEIADLSIVDSDDDDDYCGISEQEEMDHENDYSQV
ncbi:uncharacterized protein TRIVIDRAFT_219483 [Trichoderma virens Gv29-8]|uniref:HNH nuclease domain-containing protein n=1 Tax=Hypocrea virens (strain Gv29-8 / FGSC 10586) TaxID=413071 RepID=G9MJR0_HYPVG|nr:uncharacterized protein TRIVIDRAFT_219483 [Trichoderma virens Gv29-8]EHK25722.1 hypothetical protein TRIVIDRAFT_219483 [Trichoderma virens Gv29-8]UKZ48458.1 hypothetical protein TrVGV298_002683 [Trichoderma virens]